MRVERNALEKAGVIFACELDIWYDNAPHLGGVTTAKGDTIGLCVHRDLGIMAKLVPLERREL
jgi:hypothetical protein